MKRSLENFKLYFSRTKERLALARKFWEIAMTIYHIDSENLIQLDKTSLTDARMKEKDLQNMLESNVEAIAPGTMVIDKEFNN